MTPVFEWDRDVNLPVSGRTPAARHASATGALAASRTCGRHETDYLVCLYGFGVSGRNDFDAAEQIGVYRTTINSIRDLLMRAGLVKETGAFDTAIFGERRTKRQRYRLTADGRMWVANMRML